MRSSYDVTVIGGGPVGCTTALGFAERGARVALLEANTNAAKRLAGEWMHPVGADILARYGMTPGDVIPSLVGRGFVILPDDGDDPIVLNYADGTQGFSCEHHLLMDAIRGIAMDHSHIDWMPHSRATDMHAGCVEVHTASGTQTLRTERIIGADGRGSRTRKALGIHPEQTVVSHMAGVLLRDCTLPHEEFGHVLVGGPGPILAYRVTPQEVRLVIDVPTVARPQNGRAAFLWDAYAPVLPESMRQAFRTSLENDPIAWAVNSVRLRQEYGTHHIGLVGDAVGHFHPLTAFGMTAGLLEAESLVSLPFDQHVAHCKKVLRVPALLAVLLYDVFQGNAPDAIAMRNAVYGMWRKSPAECLQTMKYLAAQDTDLKRFWRSFVSVVTVAAGAPIRQSIADTDLQHLGSFFNALKTRRGFMLGSIVHQSPIATRTFSVDQPPQSPAKSNTAPTGHANHSRPRSAKETLTQGVRHLFDVQLQHGGWEGEVVWCSMLAAQYVMASFIMNRPISKKRGQRILLHFDNTQGDDGAWTIADQGPPNLFGTTLTYVAARLLGRPAQHPSLVKARAFMHQQTGTLGVPSWGKFWLALMGLYGWEGVNPILPEAWRLPKALPIHPSRYYCHTRLIYMGMAYLYGLRTQISFNERTGDILNALRNELYPQGYDSISFQHTGHIIRAGDLYEAPPLAARLLFKASRLFDRWHSKKLRAQVLDELLGNIRYEQSTTDFTCISPVSGILNILALWANDPKDPGLETALNRFEAWFWEDDTEGLRISGARSATWDTAWALQSLTAARPHVDITTPWEKGAAFLRTQQIRTSFDDFEIHDRIDPKGGFCFAEAWHGWPVSDCTAEAICALLEDDAVPQAMPNDQALEAVQFLLRCQNKDGGFGTYEARRTPFGLEWMNPAEMFGDSMTEASYIECTASCIAALAVFRKRFPAETSDIDTAIKKAKQSLLYKQRPDGAWRGFWGVNFIYGTLFGIRGLLAAGVPAHNPAVRRACQWLVHQQNEDGGFGEALRGCWEGAFVPHPKGSQPLHTAWALIALGSAGWHDFGVLERAAGFLADTQTREGGWPQPEPAGVFFRTALLDYRLYKRYFPVWALGVYETRRNARLSETDLSRSTRKANKPDTSSVTASASLSA